ncbi:MAG: hypothetical protein R3F43_05840 [bacterium]
MQTLKMSLDTVDRGAAAPGDAEPGAVRLPIYEQMYREATGGAE